MPDSSLKVSTKQNAQNDKSSRRKCEKLCVWACVSAASIHFCGTTCPGCSLKGVTHLEVICIILRLTRPSKPASTQCVWRCQTNWHTQRDRERDRRCQGEHRVWVCLRVGACVRAWVEGTAPTDWHMCTAAGQCMWPVKFHAPCK